MPTFHGFHELRKKSYFVNISIMRNAANEKHRVKQKNKIGGLPKYV